MILQNHHGFDLGLAPDAGGSVTHFRFRGMDILRPACTQDQGLPLPMQLSAFPLFPFSGRIGNGKFQWQGRHVTLAPNFPPEPHAIHGQSWRAHWDVRHSSADTAALHHVHAQDAWPWAYEAVQEFRLTAEGMTLDLSLTNLSDETMPAGLGWHPYFPAEGAIIDAGIVEAWPIGADKLSSRPAPPSREEQLAGGRAVSSLRLDTPFLTDSTGVKITWPERGVTVRIQMDNTLRFLVVYTPEGEDHFCAEPVSHVPNVMNLDAPADRTGLVALPPGGMLFGRIQIRVEIGKTEAGTAGGQRMSAR